MRKWAKSTSRAALVAAGALAMGAAFGSGAAASAGTGYGGGHDGKVDMKTSGNFGIGNGNQVYAPISIPIDVCGNAVAIAGLAQAQCKGGAKVSSHRSQHGYAADQGYRTAGAWDGGDGWDGWKHGKSVNLKSFGNFGIGNGNQLYAPISIPIDVCGNSVGAFGLARAQCKGGASVKRTGDRNVDMKTKGNFGALNGNQLYAPISIPINACGNSVGAFGAAEAQCKGGASVTDGGGGLPPTLRTPPVKKHKPSKHRPAAKHKKLPSTMRADGRRMADTGRSYRTAQGLPAVQQLLNTVGGAGDLGGMDLRSAEAGPLGGAGAPVRIGSPVLS